MKVYVEAADKRAFACAVDWPGWCRAGKDEDAAVASLVAYTDRYAELAELAGDATGTRCCSTFSTTPGRCRTARPPAIEAEETIACGGQTSCGDFGTASRPGSS
jgi:hypothetical protein